MKKTHIPKLDDFLGGGVPPGSSVLFYADPGVECEAFGYQTLQGRLEEGDQGFIFTNVTEPSSIIYEFEKFGWDLEKSMNEGKAFFVDGSSYFIGAPVTGKYGIEDYSQIEEVVLKAIADVPDGLGVINNLSTLIDYMDDEETIRIINKWNQFAKEQDTILLYIFTEWDYEEDLIEKIKNSMDCLINLNTIEERVIIGQGFMVTGASWVTPSDNMVLFNIQRPGGVKIFIPKILVTGPFNAGKSSFVKNITTDSVSVDRMALGQVPTTIAMDIGHMEYKGFTADVFGTPGQERFDLILDVLSKEAVGAFILVDSTAPKTFPGPRK
ncbi:ATPase domain-containing protein [Methanobacterium subterraneum]|uniref:ATPase domain-containing protein n=1 Tax=Methanobacterium subterraneum TaxID=59277 RepID=UPI001F018547|nr:ATPase domain-containing protein [Methanobacterium subterraneum]